MKLHYLLILLQIIPKQLHVLWSYPEAVVGGCMVESIIEGTHQNHTDEEGPYVWL